MYETFFGLRARPFSLRPDPDFLYLSHQHSLALSMLEFSLTGEAGIVVVTGEIGSGKTTLIRHFLRQGERSTVIGLISNTHAGMGGVLQWVLQALKIETRSMSKSVCHKALLAYLAQQSMAGHQVVLIVDEAQNLSIAALEELRLLSNIEENTLQIALVGQPELFEKLRRPELKQFSQRISVHYHLMPLTYRESCCYMRHRLAVAGARQEIFDRLAMGAVYYFSGGIPRWMNSICDMAMVYAYAAGEQIVDVDTVLTVVQDREKNGVLTLARRSSDVSREDLIDRALRSFDEGEYASPAGQAANGHSESISIVSSQPNGLSPLPAEGVFQSEPEVTSVTRSSGEELAALPGYEIQRPLPPITAVYLPNDDLYRNGMPAQRRPSALQWLRRHLVMQRDH
jgi:general secretion pathway protein A